MHWGRRGGIREQRSIKPAAGQDPRLPQGAFENLGADTDYSEPRIYDPTANSFTLWPLSVQSCPTPQWTLDEELSSLVIRTERKYATVDYNDHCSIDHERENEKTDSLANQTRQTLMQLLNNLYECHPPHSSCIPIFTRGKLYKSKLVTSWKTGSLYWFDHICLRVVQIDQPWKHDRPVNWPKKRERSRLWIGLEFRTGSGQLHIKSQREVSAFFCRFRTKLPSCYVMDKNFNHHLL